MTGRDTEARFSQSAVLSGACDGADWAFAPLPARGGADFIVDSEAPTAPPTRFRTLQEAIDEAIRQPRSDHQRPVVIQINPGFYTGPVFIPAEAPPLTLLGAGRDTVTLAAAIDAQMPGRTFQERFGAEFAHAHPTTRAQFARICARATLTTGNSAVLRIARDDVTVHGMTIRNDYACDRAAAAPSGAIPDAYGRYAQGQHQAVALHVDGADRVRLSGLALSSFQDTLYLANQPNGRSGRSCLTDCLIEGDVDFIFGGATGYFSNCEIRTRGLRGAQSWALAPSTNLRRPFGFVFNRCRFTHDGAEAGQKGRSFLGRQWFEGVRATPYGIPTLAGYASVLADTNQYREPTGTISQRTLEAVGKAVILDSDVGPHIDGHAPWDAWQSGAWSPRFRPVQETATDFLNLLNPWLEQQGADYSDLDRDLPWLWVHHSQTT